MRFDLSQKLRASQQLRLAPRLIQSMEVLQMPLAQLQERVEQELERNVAIEQVEPEPEAADEEAAAATEPAEPDIPEKPLESGDPGGAFERVSAFERDYGESHQPPARRDGDRDAKHEMLAQAAARREPLSEQLRRQWELIEVDEPTRRAGRAILDFVDDDGLLSADLAAIAAHASRDGAALDAAALERALPQLQRWLEPPGVAARDVRESLLIQIDARLDAQRWIERPSPADEAAWRDARALVESHYEDLLENRLPRIAARSGMTLERIEAARDRLRRLTISPGRDLTDEAQRPIVPDVMVEYDAEGDRYVAAICDGSVPPLRVSPRYAAMAERDSTDAAARKFVQDGIRSATWLIDAITQRRTTLLKVVEVVLQRQREWFDEGDGHLRPLPMTEVADAIGVHVATVSRAVAGKWMQTPRGLVELRRFFTGGTENAAGESVSWEAVRSVLQEIVDAEDKTRPLSDEAIAARLRERGLTIARRTVVKYREQMGIQPARRRRRHTEGDRA
jgi:RNA polymerase sigma-54 factor